MGANIDPAQRLTELSRYQNAVAAADSFRSDGYMNMLTKVGTLQDNSTGWDYLAEPIVADQKLSSMYISNGLFAKIIDRPAEDAIAKGLDLSDLGDDLEKEVFTRLDALKFNDAIITAEKWSRLYGGSLVVMLVDDGRGLDEPLDWKNITSIEELIPFERPLIQADTSDYVYSASFAEQHRKFGEPAFYDVYSQYGSFRVDASRCLVFRNGRVPESSRTAVYRHWGIPVYLKIKEALREAVTAHHDGTKLLERSVLGVYKMKNLSQLLATDEGEDKVIQRLQVIDMARNIINSMAIDVDGEDYQYINASMSGASDIIDRTCNMLSAVTDIPQTILFGKDPAGENSTGDNDRDNYFQLLNRIQTNSYKDAAIKVVKIVLKAMVADGTQEDQIPQYEVRFNPMKQLSEEEQANIDSIKAGTEQTKASTAQIYVDMQALDPSEVRKGLANLEEYQIQGIVENDDLEIPEEAYDLRKQFAELNQIGGEGAENGNALGEEEMPQSADGGLVNEDGGPGSGNWGHSGRPGMRGGSGSGGGIGLSNQEKITKMANAMSPSEKKLFNKANEDSQKAVKNLNDTYASNKETWDKASKAVAEGRQPVTATAAAKDHTIPGASKEAQAAYDAIRAKEPQISKDMIEIAGQSGSEMYGLDFSVKTGKSIASKIARKKADPKHANESDEQIVNGMGDLVRYTQLTDHNNIAAATKNTVDQLRKKGYTVNEVDNKYNDPKSDYKGVHIGAISPSGQQIELQIHSKQSMQVKETIHPMYDVSRESSGRLKNALKLEMRDISSTLAMPKDISSVKTWKK